MTSQTPPLPTDLVNQAMSQASKIADAISSPVVGSNEFVFFAAFDGTNNGANPPADGSGNSQTTAIRQLFNQVLPQGYPVGNVGGYYSAGVGTPGSLPFSSAWSLAVTAQSIENAEDAYNLFAFQAFNWLLSHPGGTLTSMITGFSRGGAAAAIFAQMLYEQGLVYDGHMLIPPGAVSAVSAALIIDPVLTGVNGNMEFPPGVQNLTIVQAQNEYRSEFEAANYKYDNANILPVIGNHGDAGDLYDNGLGGIYLKAYTNFFKKAGLNIAAVPPSRAYTNGTPVVVHSESLQLGDTGFLTQPWDATYNTLSILSPDYLTFIRHVVLYGTNGVPATVSGNATSFTTYNGDIVLAGTGGDYNYDSAKIFLLTNSHATVTGSSDSGDIFTLASGANLTFKGSDASIFASNASITLTADDSDISISGSNNVIILGAGASFGNVGNLASDTITFDMAGGGSITFSPGTADYGSTEIVNPSNGNINVQLVSGDPISLGALSINTGTGADSLTLNDGPESIQIGSVITAPGLTLTLPGITDNVLSDPAAGTSPLQTLEDYLIDLGDFADAGTIVAANYDYFNPSGTTYTVTGGVTAIDNYTSADVYYGALEPGAVVTGSQTAQIPVDGTLTNVPAYNIFTDAGQDLAQDTISNMQELYVYGDAALTEDEFDNFSFITSAPNAYNVLTAASGGTFDLTSSNVDQTASFNLTATDWSDTTLIGDDQDYQVLTASLFGDDTLQAGDGTGDILIAGDGVDTLIGGSGGDTFEATNGLADGSSVTGSASGNVLETGGDLTDVTISGIQTLEATANVTLTVTEFDAFDSFVRDGGATLYAATPGTYNLTGRGGFNLTALSDDGTTLIGSDNLTASATGDDTLEGSGVLTAGGGNDTLIGGDLNAGTGVDLLEGGGYIYAENGLAAGSTVEGKGSATLTAGGDISGATVTGIAALVATSDLTLTAAELVNVGTVEGPDGTTLFAATGGTYDLPGNSNNLADYYDPTYNVFNMTALSSDGTTLNEGYAVDATLTASYSGNDTLIVSNGGSNTLDASASVGNVTLDASADSSSQVGMDTLYAGAGTDTIYASNAVIYGGTGPATIYDSAFEGVNVVNGSSGNITDYLAPYGGDLIDAGSGTTTVYSSSDSIGTVTSDNGGLVVIESGDTPSGIAGVHPETAFITVSANSGTIEIAADDGEPVTFTSHSSPVVLRLDQPINFDGEVNGLASGDIINLPSVTYNSSMYVLYNYANSNQIRLIDLENYIGYPIQLGSSSSLTGETFEAVPDGSGTDIIIGGDSWSNATSGDWSDAMAWGAMAAPTSTSLVTIGGSETYTVTLDVAATVTSLTLSDSSVTLNLNGRTLTVSDTITVAEGTIDLNGMLQGDTVQIWNTGTVLLAGGTLDTDPLTLAAGGQMYGTGVITGDIDDFSTITALSGTLELTGEISGTGTLVIAANSELKLDGIVDPGVTIDFASGGTGILRVADLADIQGTIEGKLTGDHEVIGNGVTWISPTSDNWSDPGAWDAGAAPTSTNAVTIGGDDTYTVTLDVDGTVASLGMLNSAATLNINGHRLTDLGILTLAAGTLDGARGWLLDTTLELAGGSFVPEAAELSDVTIRGVLDFSATNSYAGITNGFTLENAEGTGPGTINLTGTNAGLESQGSPTLNGGIINLTGLNADLIFDGTATLDDATINIGNDAGGAYILVIGANGASLTLGDRLNIVQTGTYAGLGELNPSYDFANLGTITAAVLAGQFRVNSVFTNGGGIAVSNSDTLRIDAANFSNTSAGTITVGSGALLDINLSSSGQSWTNDGLIAITGAKAEFFDNIAGTRAIELSDDASMELDGTGGVVSFGTGGATLQLDLLPTAATSPLIENFFAGDTIDLKGLAYVQGSTTPNYTVATGILQLTNGTQTASVDFGAGNSLVDDPFHVASDGFGGTRITNDAVMCFCRGTLIRTDAGDVAVESLAIEDKVLTLAGQARRIVWIGKGKVLATRYRRTAATPVIVRKGALADNVPNRDLHITRAHGLYIDGVLIPVEFLVNHRTILWDDRAQEVEIYHIELESHDVLIANGAPAESYRDDGNRWLFQNANSGWHLPPQEPCAPVMTGGPVVDAAWRRLLDRAGPRNPPPLTDDPDLHLLVAGARLDAATRMDGIYVFNLRSTPAELRLVSRAIVPQEVGLSRDPRCLGVAVKRIVVRQGTRFRSYRADDGQLTEGFHPFEADTGLRWTDGDAILPPAMSAGLSGPRELVLHLGGATQYIEGLAASRAA